MKKTIYRISIILVSICAIGVALFGRVFPSILINTKTKTTVAHTLKMNSNIYFRQTYNNCGPYSVMAVLNITKGQIINPELLAQEIKWRIHKNLTFPQVVVNLLHKYSIHTSEYCLYNYDANEKVKWIKKNISNGYPVILLIKVHGIQHYVTVVGYDEYGIMLYDCFQDRDETNKKYTIIDKKCLSGNRYYLSDKLIKLWDMGGYKIFFKNWAIVCK